MGTCFSAPEQPANGRKLAGDVGLPAAPAPLAGDRSSSADVRKEPPFIKASQQTDDLDNDLDSARVGSRVGSITIKRMRSTTRAALHLEFLNEVHGLQQQLALVNDNPLLGLQEAAELLATQLGADLTAIWVQSKGDPQSSVLMAACGEGADVLQRSTVHHHCDGSRLGAAVSMVVADAAAERVEDLPADLWLGPSALRSFVQVPIGTPTAPLGALLMAKKEPGCFSGNWWQVRLHIASTGLLPHVRHAQVDQMAHLLKSMDETQDPVALISVLLRSASRYMFKTCSMRMNVRLALLQDDPSKALLFEPTRTAPAGSSVAGGGAPGSPGSRLVASGDSAADVSATFMGLSNTLMASAMKQQQARFISDCGLYMQTCLKPARDVFTRSSELVSSIVVVPLIAGSQPPLGAIYFTLDTPCEFANIQDTLLGFISSVTPTLYHKLAGRADLLVAMVAKLNRKTSQPLSVADTTRDIGSVTEATSGYSDSVGPAAAQAAPATDSAGGAPSRQLSKIGAGQRLNTDAMLQVLQQQIRSKSRQNSANLSATPELSVGECLGRGGFGVVYRGRWHRVPVAVKVMPSRTSEREALQDAVEMAVLSSVQHPNIVSVYSCLTDMVEAGDADSSVSGSCSGSISNPLRTRFRRLQPDEDPEGDVPTFNVVVMEFCDRGTLRDAIKSGLLHRQLPGGAIGVDLGAAVEVMLDVAYAVQYLHSMQLLHGDIKLENILLKSDQPRRLGVTPKLADFGLTKILNEAHHTVNLDGAGTVTHLAPEMFQAGSKVTKAVDSYAFGIFMWECYTSKRAYAGLSREAVIERVFKTGMRPRFPSSAPPAFASLAEACWQSNPAARPTFLEIAERLEQMAPQLAPGAGVVTLPGPQE